MMFWLSTLWNMFFKEEAVKSVCRVPRRSEQFRSRRKTELFHTLFHMIVCDTKSDLRRYLQMSLFFAIQICFRLNDWLIERLSFEIMEDLMIHTTTTWWWWYHQLPWNRSPMWGENTSYIYDRYSVEPIRL